MDNPYRTVSDADKLFYYLFSEEESCSILLNFTLRVPVNKVHLKKAVNEALKRYPNFRQTPVLDRDGYLYTKDNDQEAEVYPYDPDPVDFGTKDTNGYLFRVMFMGKRLWISVFHSVCDGRGLYMFARTLLYYYFTFGGCNIANPGHFILTEEVPSDPTEMADPFAYHKEFNPSAHPAFERKTDNPVFKLPEEVKGVDKCEYHRKFQYILNTKKFLELAHQAETSFDAYFNLLVAKTIHDSYDTKGKLIMELGAVDLRPFYGSHYLQNMRELFWVPFIEPLFKVPEKFAALMVRDVLMRSQLQKAHYDGIVYQSIESYKEMFNFPLADTEGLKRLRHGLWEDPFFKTTYFCTNMGPLGLGEDIDPFVEMADCSAPCLSPHPYFLLVTQGKVTTVNFIQRHFDKKLALKLLGTFRELGVLEKYVDCGRFESDKLHVRSLVREK